MKHQKELLLARKKELRIILKEFELTFVGLHGRYSNLPYYACIIIIKVSIFL